jgi:hypothetical protein
MEVGAVSVICDINVVAPDFEVLAMERLANVTDELVDEVSIFFCDTDSSIQISGAHMNDHLVLMLVKPVPSDAGMPGIVYIPLPQPVSRPCSDLYSGEY